jgi:hypothetical protein
MIQQILDSELNGRVKKDDELKLKIAKANNVKVDTVTRWLREDDVMLTTATNLSIIRTHLGLPAKQVMTKDKTEPATAK